MTAATEQQGGTRGTFVTFSPDCDDDSWYGTFHYLISMNWVVDLVRHNGERLAVQLQGFEYLNTEPDVAHGHVVGFLWGGQEATNTKVSIPVDDIIEIHVH